MKLGVVGLGSMGKRRVRDLLELGAQVVGFDIRPDRNLEAAALFGIVAHDSFDDVMAHDVDAIVISTPPDCHVEYYERCYDARRPFFSEANIFVPSADWFLDRERAAGVRGYPSATWRFHPLVHELHQRIQSLGRRHINSVAHQYGGFLPDWHPWEPYTSFYAGRRRTSAAREMVPFELEILTHAFGPIERVSAVATQARAWEADFTDSYMLLLQFESGVAGTLTIELHQVAPVRLTRVSCTSSALVLDMSAQQLAIFDQQADRWQYIKPRAIRQNWGFQFEHVYREEMRQFLAALAGSEYPKTWSDDRHLSDVLYAAELSASTGKAVQVRDISKAYDGIGWCRE